MAALQSIEFDLVTTKCPNVYRIVRPDGSYRETYIPNEDDESIELREQYALDNRLAVLEARAYVDRLSAGDWLPATYHSSLIEEWDEMEGPAVGLEVAKVLRTYPGTSARSVTNHNWDGSLYHALAIGPVCPLAYLAAGLGVASRSSLWPEPSGRWRVRPVGVTKA